MSGTHRTTREIEAAVQEAVLEYLHHPTHTTITAKRAHELTPQTTSTRQASLALRHLEQEDVLDRFPQANTTYRYTLPD